MRDLLMDAARRGIDYLEGLEGRSVAPTQDALKNLDSLDFPLPESPKDPQEVLAVLDEFGSPATMASAGMRYYGFVIGGSLPATLAANWLAGAWDQNAFGPVASPVGAKLEEVALKWLVELIGLPETTGMGFVSGATMANFSGLLAARHALLARQGWDPAAQGMFGAPEIKVVVGEEVHASAVKALTLAGFGKDRFVKVPVDDQGRIKADKLPEIDDKTIVCVQAGNVNSGAFDPPEVIQAAKKAGAWVHVDGAFGLWAAVSPKYKHLFDGYQEADSWATDAHKWLNVPYDSGLVFMRQPEHLAQVMSTSGAYLIRGKSREPYDFTPEMSRRARGIEIWAALASLGRRGMAEMIERNCGQAQKLAKGLEEQGFAVLNEVVLNQVVVSFGDAERTNGIIQGIQEDGVFWAGGTVWQGQTAMRVSFSSWATQDEDVDRTLDSIRRVAEKIK